MIFDPATTAFVRIDLQQGIAGCALFPRSVDEIISRSCVFADRCRAAGAPVVNVRVSWHHDFADAPSSAVDKPMALPEGGLPAGFDAFVEGLMTDGDLEIVKRQWGAFHGTELDLQLRRRGIRTMIVAGIATNFGVESTVRDAWEHGYHVVVAEDLCASVTAELHDISIGQIMPRIARVTTADAIAFDA